MPSYLSRACFDSERLRRFLFKRVTQLIPSAESAHLEPVAFIIIIIVVVFFNVVIFVNLVNSVYEVWNRDYSVSIKLWVVNRMNLNTRGSILSKSRISGKNRSTDEWAGGRRCLFLPQYCGLREQRGYFRASRLYLRQNKTARKQDRTFRSLNRL